MVAPLVTVVVPTFNAERYLGETLDSLLAQTFSDFELLVLDDGSIDGTRQVVEARRDPRIRFAANGENIGLPATMNKALALAQGEYLARCDHDDIADPTRLEKQLAFMEQNPEVAICGSAMQCFGYETGQVIPPSEDGLIKAHLVEGSHHLFNPTSISRLSFVRSRTLKFDPSLFAADDYGFWVAATAAGAVFHNIPEPLMAYRFHESNASKINVDWRIESVRRVRLRVMSLYFPDLTVRELGMLNRMFFPGAPEKDSERSLLPGVVQKAMAVQDLSYGQDKTRVGDILDHFASERLKALGG